jgi:transcription-repair coupling factor (superfamily II helicase)
MAMLGLRDISSLTTAPVDRRSVVTEVMPWNETRIARAIKRELARDGQVYFVHNRVHNIRSVADDVKRMAPEARVVVGHGQMTPHELEEVMGAFIRREADILVSTTIIESGIDIPTANTMFIADADRFGLADLHQMRGRVGRYKHRAYCYLLLPSERTITDVAKKRLHAIEEFSMLGSGFRIAMRDLEIRGAGNLLGPEQSGHIASVGYDMYCRLLEEAAKSLKGETTPREDMPTIEMGLTGTLSRRYIPSEARRLEAYRRIAEARTFEALEKVEADLLAAYGDPPEAARRLLDLAEVRVGLSMRGVRSLVVKERDVVLRTEDAEATGAMLESAEGSVRVVDARGTDEVREVYYRPPESYLEPSSLMNVLRSRVREAVPAGA